MLGIYAVAVYPETFLETEGLMIESSTSYCLTSRPRPPMTTASGSGERNAGSAVF